MCVARHYRSMKSMLNVAPAYFLDLRTKMSTPTPTTAPKGFLKLKGFLKFNVFSEIIVGWNYNKIPMPPYTKYAEGFL